MQDFQIGPFEYRAGQRATIAGKPMQAWTLCYDGQGLAEQRVPASATQAEISDALDYDRSEWLMRMRSMHAPDVVHLVDFETDDAVASIITDSTCGMSAGMINDSSALWLRSANRLYSRPVSLQQFAALAAQHAAPARAWIAGLLPDDVLTVDADEWRPPTPWELRHLVGVGSLTGITGGAAAALCGVSPQNFRKYTARDGASNQQNMSFAMWHLLLHRLGVQVLAATL